MKRKFSTAWKESKQPRKQRKYLANAPIHLKKKLMSSNLSKELRKKYGRRSLPLKTGDVIKVMRGKFRGKKGKVTKIELKMLRLEAENIQVKKQDGSKANVPLKASNVQITELSLDDRKRSKQFKLKKDTGTDEKEFKTVTKSQTKKETRNKKEEIKNAS